MKIKKGLILSITAIMLSMTMIPAYAKNDSSIKIVVKNEVALSANPYILDDQVMIPIRSFAESQGCDVLWNRANKEVTILKQGKVLYKIKNNSDIAYLEGKKYKLKNPAVSVGGRTFIEAEFLNYAHKVNIEINSNDIKQYIYKFEKGNAGFEPIFSEYNYDETGDYKIYEMKSDYKQIPVINKESMGLYIASHNRSDDVFMGFVKKINGLAPNKEYNFNVQFQLATDAEPGGFGIGGSPSSSVYVKVGASAIKPESILDKEKGIYRMNIDIGMQSQDGKEMQTIGDVGKLETSSASGFAYKTMKATVKVISDENGCAFLIIGTDSGYEGFTEYYIDNVKISVKL